MIATLGRGGAEEVRITGQAAVSHDLALRESSRGEKLDAGSRRQRLTLLCFVSSVALASDAIEAFLDTPSNYALASRR